MSDETFEVDIEKIVAGGSGLARHDGQVVFVAGVVPTERHRVRVLDKRKDFLRAESVERITDAPSRRSAPCTHAERCGGCALMHLDPATQLDSKRGILAECLRRAGVVSATEVPVAVRSAAELGYRNRVRFHVAEGKEAPKAMGFRHRGSHAVEDIDRCIVTTDGLNACWNEVRAFFRERPDRLKDLDSVELQESSHEEGRIVGRFFVHSRSALQRFDPETRTALRRATGMDGIVVSAKGKRRGPELFSGDPWVSHRIAPEGLDPSTWRQTAGSFFQTNRFLLESLVSAVRPGGHVPRIVDLYAGVGLFALPLARYADQVLAVESSPSAVADGIYNQKRSGGAAVRFVREDAARFAQTFSFEATDYVVLDPPRGGLPRELRERLSKSSLQKICYVSCDPPALARDVRGLEGAGFSVRSLELFDLFPNTHHFETVAHLDRSGLDSLPDPR